MFFVLFSVPPGTGYYSISNGNRENSGVVTNLSAGHPQNAGNPPDHDRQET
jgi:hypothetical protein